MRKIFLKIDENVELDYAFDFATYCVIDFITHDYKNCLYTRGDKETFVKKSKANNLIVTVTNRPLQITEN